MGSLELIGIILEVIIIIVLLALYRLELQMLKEERLENTLFRLNNKLLVQMKGELKRSKEFVEPEWREVLSQKLGKN